MSIKENKSNIIKGCIIGAVLGVSALIGFITVDKLKGDEVGLKIEKPYDDKELKGMDNYTKAEDNGSKVYWIDIQPNSYFSQIEGFKSQINAVRGSVKSGDKVVFDIFSPGGSAVMYGYAAQYMEEFKSSLPDDVEVVAFCDLICASGGYLMAVQADKVFASEWSIIGSIGVVSQITNLQGTTRHTGVYKYHVTSGKSKRTLTSWTTPTQELKDKYQSKLEEIHAMFIEEVEESRGDLSDDVFSGESWQGSYGIGLGLIDSNMLVDDYLTKSWSRGYEIVKVSYNHPRSLIERVFGLSHDVMLMHPDYIEE